MDALFSSCFKKMAKRHIKPIIFVILVLFLSHIYLKRFSFIIKLINILLSHFFIDIDLNWPIFLNYPLKKMTFETI